jgi:hypothetical protein
MGTAQLDAVGVIINDCASYGVLRNHSFRERVPVEHSLAHIAQRQGLDQKQVDQ